MEMVEERRHKSFELVELRLSGNDKQQKIEGHAAVFNVWGDGGWFREKIMPGAFTESLKVDDVRSFWNHNTDKILGRNKAGTLELSEDEVGLNISITPPDTSYGRDAKLSIERGDITQMSFGFSVPKKGDEWIEEEGQPLTRILHRVKLWEISPVAFPFYDATDVGLRDRVDLEIRGKYADWQKTITEPKLTWNRVAIMRRQFKHQQAWR